MSFLFFVKQRLTRLPFPVGRAVSLVPYNYRPGLAKIYSDRKSQIEAMDSFDIDNKKKFIFRQVKNIASFSYNNIPFYYGLYKENDVNPNKMDCFDNLSLLPTINKSMLQDVDLQYRSSKITPRMLANTGGSSGRPLEFYVPPSLIGHEWAHIHRAWSFLGFKQSDLKATFSGRSTITGIVQYDSARNQLDVDIYKGWGLVADTLYSLPRYKWPKYLHGYPSAVFDFIFWLNDQNHPLLARFRDTLDGIFLSSEYPSPRLRVKVEEILGVEMQSFYGHTERSVFAHEISRPGVFEVLHSYGFSEAVKVGESFNLIGTNYYNWCSPLIRYDTEDHIKPEFEEGLMTRFSIEEGRDGEFVEDISGNKIYLTGLIFGRHHKLFEFVKHLQVRQVSPGFVTVYFVPRSNFKGSPRQLFDSREVDIKFNFEQIDEPHRTVSGKVPLLVK